MKKKRGDGRRGMKKNVYINIVVCSVLVVVYISLQFFALNTFEPANWS